MKLCGCSQSLLQLLLLQAVAIAFSAPDPTGDDKGVIIDGDVTLGGLFPVNAATCGRGALNEQGVQRLEAMIFSLKRANADRSLLRYGRHKIQLGGLLLDTCPASGAATGRNALTELLRSHFSEDFVCRSPASESVLAGQAERLSGGATARILGVVGASKSHVTAQAARVLQLLDVPLVSYASTGSFLSDRVRLPLLARTLPPETEMAGALADIAAHFNWTYVSVVYSDSSYGQELMEKFQRKFTADRGCCVAVKVAVSTRISQEALDTVVQNLHANSKARIVVLLTPEQETQLLMEAVTRAQVPADRFVWLVAASNWARDIDSAAAIGSLKVQLDTRDMPGFAEYFTALRPGLRTDWQVPVVSQYFDEFWQLRFNCSLGSSIENPDGAVKLDGICNSSVAIEAARFVQDPKVQFVFDAVYTFAHGLHKVMKLACSSQDPDSDTKADGSFDQCVRNITEFPGRDLYGIMIDRNNSFINNANRRVEFTADGDGIVSYVIRNYQKYEAAAERQGYRTVGQWHRDAGLRWSLEQPIVWPGEAATAPASTCSDKCGPRQRKIFESRDKKCCWSCANCLPHQTVSGSGDACLD